jgi:hypothetical protein
VLGIIHTLRPMTSRLSFLREKPAIVTIFFATTTIISHEHAPSERIAAQP